MTIGLRNFLIAMVVITLITIIVIKFGAAFIFSTNDTKSGDAVSTVSDIILGFMALIAWSAIGAEVFSGRTNKFIKENHFLKTLLFALLMSIPLAIAYFSSEAERTQNTNNFCLFILLGALYFLPTILAFRFHRKNRKAICVLNIFLGWSGLGWIGALVWSFIE